MKLPGRQELFAAEVRCARTSVSWMIPVKGKPAGHRTAANAAQWEPVDPSRAASLADARLELHHAAQLPVAAAISYLPAKPDDSHTNLEWLPDLGALAGRVLDGDGTRVAVRAGQLSLLVLDGDGVPTDEYLLNTKTVAEAGRWLSTRLEDCGFNPDRFTLRKHYEIPPHAVAGGSPFRTGRSFEAVEIGRWYHNASALLTDVARDTEGASEVRCWPHHFDIATLITLPHTAGRSIGAGLEPGDRSYDEPYFYVNPSPAPSRERLVIPLAGSGHWHTQDWTGAVLRASRFTHEDDEPGSALAPRVDDQEQQARVFLKSAIAACRLLLETH